MLNETRYERDHAYSWWAPGTDKAGRVVAKSDHDDVSLNLRDGAGRVPVGLDEPCSIRIRYEEIPAVIAALDSWYKSRTATENEDPSNG